MQQEQLTILLIQCRTKNEVAFRKLVEVYQAMVFAYAYRLLCNADDAEDIVQETFLRVWKHVNNYKLEMNFKTWLFKIVTNLCYDRLRFNKRKRIAQKTSIDALMHFQSNENIETEFINSELATIINTLTNELTPKQKLVFTLRDIEGFEVNEIEEITKLSSGKIKSNLYLARQFIRMKLEQL